MCGRSSALMFPFVGHRGREVLVGMPMPPYPAHTSQDGQT